MNAAAYSSDYKLSETLQLLLVDYSLHQQLSGAWRTTSVPVLHFLIQSGSSAAPEIAAKGLGRDGTGGCPAPPSASDLGFGTRGVVHASSGGWKQDGINTIKGNYEMVDQFILNERTSFQLQLEWDHMPQKAEHLQFIFFWHFLDYFDVPTRIFCHI